MIIAVITHKGRSRKPKSGEETLTINTASMVRRKIPISHALKILCIIFQQCGLCDKFYK